MSEDWRQRENLIDAMREAVLVAARAGGRKPSLSRTDFYGALSLAVDEALTIVEPFASNQWGGAEVLSKLRAMKGASE